MNFLPRIGELAVSRQDAKDLRRALGIEQDRVPDPVYCFGCLSRVPDTLTPCPNPDVTGDWLCPRCIREGRDSGKSVERLNGFCAVCWTVEHVNTVRDDGEWLCDEHLAAPNVRPRRPVKSRTEVAGRSIDFVRDTEGDEPGRENQTRDHARELPHGR